MLKRISHLAQIDIKPDEIDVPKTGADSSIIETLLTLTFSVMGAVAFLVIVIAGMQYVLSRGDADKAAKARNTIIYAAIGLVIAVMAFTIVRFVTESTG